MASRRRTKGEGRLGYAREIGGQSARSAAQEPRRALRQRVVALRRPVRICTARWRVPRARLIDARGREVEDQPPPHRGWGRRVTAPRSSRRWIRRRSRVARIRVLMRKRWRRRRSRTRSVIKVDDAACHRSRRSGERERLESASSILETAPCSRSRRALQRASESMDDAWPTRWMLDDTRIAARSPACGRRELAGAGACTRHVGAM